MAVNLVHLKIEIKQPSFIHDFKQDKHYSTLGILGTSLGPGKFIEGLGTSDTFGAKLGILALGVATPPAELDGVSSSDVLLRISQMMQ